MKTGKIISHVPHIPTSLLKWARSRLDAATNGAECRAGLADISVRGMRKQSLNAYDGNANGRCRNRDRTGAAPLLSENPARERRHRIVVKTRENHGARSSKFASASKRYPAGCIWFPIPPEAPPDAVLNGANHPLAYQRAACQPVAPRARNTSPHCRPTLVFPTLVYLQQFCWGDHILFKIKKCNTHLKKIKPSFRRAL
jgi:hypothetical protein